MKGSKKGVMSLFDVLLIAVLAVVVLVVVLLVFGGQIRKALFGYDDISNSSIHQIRGENCRTLWGDRKCVEGSCPSEWTQVAGEWKDCSTTCCERTG